MRARVYTRHSKGCPKFQDPTARTWARCKCPKWVTVTDDGGTRRVSAKTRSWEKAEDKARRMEASGAAVASDRQTIAGAADLYLLDKRAANLSIATIYQNTHLLHRPETESKRPSTSEDLVTWMRHAGLVYLDEIRLAHLEKFRASWTGLAPLSRKVEQQRLSSFFNYCARHKWVQENLVRSLSRVHVDDTPTLPFSADEYQKLLDTAPLMYERAHSVSGSGAVMRERLLAMVLLLRWSGLRIGDAVSLERERLQASGRLSLKMAKTGEWVYLLLPQDVTDRLLRLPNSNPRYFFWTGNGRKTSLVISWEIILKRLFDKAALGHRCHPHMFRDTCAVEYLLAGMPLEQVSKLLGHASIKVTEKHYAPWVKARQDQLDDSIRKAWAQA
jgi:integrase/recombinase XerD